MSIIKNSFYIVAMMAIATAGLAYAGNPCNPCGGNPCNPCAGSDKIDAKKIKQPKGAKLAKGSAKRGMKLWNDNKLGESGLSCATCHVNDYGMMKDSFKKPYPHPVEMAKDRANMSKINAAEMVQLCMVVPMQADPLKWTSQELADLTAYVNKIRPGFKGSMGGMNPCGHKHKKMKNPCGKKRNPCNPCGM